MFSFQSGVEGLPASLDKIAALAMASSVGEIDPAFMLYRNSRVMHEALDMHDACLRAVLHQHHGYEVSFPSSLHCMHASTAHPNIMPYPKFD